MIRRIKLTFLLTLAILIWHVAAAAQPAKISAEPPVQKTPPSSVEITRSGSLENGVYKNTLVGFTVSTPKGWEIASEAMIRAGHENSREVATRGRTEPEKSSISSSISRTALLFNTMGPGGAFSCGIETLPDPRVTVETYIDHNQRLILSIYPNSSIVKTSYSKRVGGAEFTAFEVEIPQAGNLHYQTFVVTKRRNLMLFFVMTYQNAATMDNLENTLSTLKLDN